MRALLLAGVAALGWAGTAQAAFVETVLETAIGVAFTGTGSINTTGLSIEDRFFDTYGSVDPNQGFISYGSGYYYNLSKSSPGFGRGNYTAATSFSSGDAFFLCAVCSTNSANQGTFGVSASYQSGTPLSNSFTMGGTSFRSLGLTPGTYVYNLNSGANADTITVQIGPAATAVPEPTSLVLLGLGVAGVAAARRRRAA